MFIINNNINTHLKYVNLINKYGGSYCDCVKRENTDFLTKQTGNMSKNMKIAQKIKNTKGGKLQYGNFYLGQPLNVNYLGRLEGQSGGSGMPPKNKFI